MSESSNDIAKDDVSPETPRQIILVPCSGNNGIKTSPNHIYRAEVVGGSRSSTYSGHLGYFDTVEAAEEVFGKGNVRASGSHGLCPKCYEYLMSE